MKNVSLISLAAILIFTAFASCNKEKQKSNCVGYTSAIVTNVVAPDSVAVNQETDIIISHYLTDGCGKNEGLEATSNGSTTIIRIKAKYEGCICTQVILSGQSIYKFKKGQAGVYYLKFLQPNNTFLSDTINVY